MCVWVGTGDRGRPSRVTNSSLTTGLSVNYSKGVPKCDCLENKTPLRWR